MEWLEEEHDWFRDAIAGWRRRPTAEAGGEAQLAGIGPGLQQPDQPDQLEDPPAARAPRPHAAAALQGGEVALQQARAAQVLAQGDTAILHCR